MNILVANLMESAFTFRKGTTEKLVFVGLNLLDLVLTLFALSMDMKELNPIVSHLYNNPYQMWIVKLLIPLLFAWVSPGKLLIPSIGFLSLVIGWNIKELIIYFI